MKIIDKLKSVFRRTQTVDENPLTTYIYKHNPKDFEIVYIGDMWGIIHDILPRYQIKVKDKAIVSMCYNGNEVPDSDSVVLKRYANHTRVFTRSIVYVEPPDNSRMIFNFNFNRIYVNSLDKEAVNSAIAPALSDVSKMIDNNPQFRRRWKVYPTNLRINTHI